MKSAENQRACEPSLETEPWPPTFFRRHSRRHRTCQRRIPTISAPKSAWSLRQHEAAHSGFMKELRLHLAVAFDARQPQLRGLPRLDGLAPLQQVGQRAARDPCHLLMLKSMENKSYSILSGQCFSHGDVHSDALRQSFDEVVQVGEAVEDARAGFCLVQHVLYIRARPRRKHVFEGRGA